MADINTSLYLRLRSDVSKTARRDARALEKMGRSGSKAFKKIGRSARRSTSAIRRHGTAAARRFMGSTTGKIAAGIGVGAALNIAAKRQQQKAYLQATSGKTANAVDAIFDKITQNALATGLSIDKQVQFLKAMQDMGGFLDVAAQKLRLFSDVMQGTGASAEDVAGMASAIKQVLQMNLEEAFAIFVEQGKKGNATLAQLARYAPAPLGAYKALTGRSGEQTAREVGAMMQVATSALGGVEKGSTATRALIARLTDQDNLDLMEHSGIETEDANGNTRNLLDLLGDIAKITQGDAGANKRTAQQLGVGVEELPLFLRFMGAGLKEARDLAAVKVDKNTLPRQAKPLQSTAAAGVARAAALAEQVAMPIANKLTRALGEAAADPVGTVEKIGEGALEVAKSAVGMGMEDKARAQWAGQDRTTAQHVLKSSPEQQASQQGQRLIRQVLKRNHLAKETNHLLKQLVRNTKPALKPLIPPPDVGRTDR